MSNLRRRDFLGLVSAIAACGLPVAQAAASVEPPKAVPKKRKPAPMKRKARGFPQEDWIRACLLDAIAVDVMETVTFGGAKTTRIRYRKMSPGAAEKCHFKDLRARAEKGSMRSVEAMTTYPLADVGLDRLGSFCREWLPDKWETEIIIEWVHA